MSDLQKELDEVALSVKENVPGEVFDTMIGETEKLKASGIEGRAIQDDETAPDFNLTNHLGKEMSLNKMLGEGPVVVSFYRGGW